MWAAVVAVLPCISAFQIAAFWGSEIEACYVTVADGTEYCYYQPPGGYTCDAPGSILRNNTIPCTAGALCYAPLAGDREVCYYTQPYGYDCYYEFDEDLISNMTHCDLLKANNPPEIDETGYPSNGFGWAGNEDQPQLLATIAISDSDARTSETEPGKGFLDIKIEATKALVWFNPNHVIDADERKAADDVLSLDKSSGGHEMKVPEGALATDWSTNASVPSANINFEAYTDPVIAVFKALSWQGLPNMNSDRYTLGSSASSPSIKITVNDQGNTGGNVGETEQTYFLNIAPVNDDPYAIVATPAAAAEETPLVISGTQVGDVDWCDTESNVDNDGPDSCPGGGTTFGCPACTPFPVPDQLYVMLKVVDADGSTTAPSTPRGDLSLTGPGAPSCSCGDAACVPKQESVAAPCYDAGEKEFYLKDTPTQLNTWLSQITFTPAEHHNDAAGVAYLYVYVADGLQANSPGTSRTWIPLSVTAVNDPPTISLTSGTSIGATEDVAQNVLNVILVADVDTANGFEITVSVDNGGTLTPTPAFNPGGLVAGPSLTYTSVDSSDFATLFGSIQYQAASDFNGDATLTVQVNDHDPTSPQTTTETFTISVTAVNDAPLLYFCHSEANSPCNGANSADPSLCSACTTTEPPNLSDTALGGTIDLSIRAAPAAVTEPVFQLGDVDVGTNNVQLLVTAEHGTFTMTGWAPSGVTYTIPLGAWTPSTPVDTLLMIGPLEELNEGLQRLQYTKDSTAFGETFDEVIVAVNDLKHNGDGAAGTDFVELQVAGNVA